MTKEKMKPCPFDGAAGKHVLVAGYRYVKCTKNHEHRGANGCHVGMVPGTLYCNYCLTNKCECTYATKAWNTRSNSPD